MSHIFLSYSRHDSAYVDRVARCIVDNGHRVWIDRRGIAAGEQWRREIVEAIKGASLMIVFLSPNSARSNNVRRELDLADNARLKILPTVLAPTQIPDAMQYQLAGVQMIELWRDQDQGVRILLKAIGRSGVAPNPRPQPVLGKLSIDEPEVDLAKFGGAGFLEGLRNIKLFGRKS
jgi:hypothetical protein